MKKRFLPVLLFLTIILQSCSLPTLTATVPADTATLTPTPTPAPDQYPAALAYPDPDAHPAARRPPAKRRLLVQAGDYANAIEEYTALIRHSSG